MINACRRRIVTLILFLAVALLLSFATGCDSLRGEPGLRGDQGIQGEQGPKGEQGLEGKSAYQYAVEAGFTGTEEEFAAKISGNYVTVEEIEKLLGDLWDKEQNQPVWYALGDSITQGYTSYYKEDGGSASYIATEGRWVDYVADINGYELHNFGVGGTGYARGQNNARELVDSIDFSGCDLVTLAYGINDFKYTGVNIGSMEDDIDSTESMVANMRYCIKKILADNPLCKIYVITPMNYRDLGNYSTNYSINYTGEYCSGGSLANIYNLMEEVCTYHGVAMIDMTYSSIVNRENIKTLLPDYIHPSAEAHRVMGMELAGQILYG